MEKLKLEFQEKVAVITFNSPPANALSSSLLHELADALDKVEKNKKVKAIVLKGEGRFFSAGADIKEFTSHQENADHQSLAGGLELAMSCHMRIVTKTAKLGLPELTLGIIPGFAGTQRLPRYVGQAKAYEMILTGKPITGEEAAQLGLANHAVEEEELSSFTMNLVNQIVDKSGPSIHAVMKLLPYTLTPQFQDGVKEEAKQFGAIFGTEDAKEGISAFIEKRKPNFKDQ